MALPGCRYIMAVLLSIGLAIIYGLKVNLSVAIVSMVNYTAIGLDNDTANPPSVELCEKPPTTEVTHKDGPFAWSSQTQGMMLSSYFWGYLAAMFPGSQMAEIISAKWVFFVAVVVNIVCTLATPIACYLHIAVVYIMRIGEGLGGGVTFPTTHVLLAHWAPPAERSTMASIAFSGTILGTVISNYLSGVTTLVLSWEWIFYTQGGLSIIWLFLWVIFVTDKPRQLKFISTKELEYIESSLGVTPEAAGRKKKRKVPFVSILKSVPFWAILVAHTCSNWAFYMLLVNMPIYMKQVLHFNAKQTGTWSAIPYIAMWAFSLFIGKLLDFLRVKKKITTTFARRCGTILASAPVILCLLGLCFVPCVKAIHVVLLTLALTSMGAMYSGFMTNHIDIANNYAGTLMGMTNTFGTIPGIVGPLFVGALTHGDPSIASWRIIFYVTCGFLVVEIIVFTIFGSGEEQAWNKAKPTPEQQELK